MEPGLHCCFEKMGGLSYIGLIQVWAECILHFPAEGEQCDCTTCECNKGTVSSQFNMHCVTCLGFYFSAATVHAAAWLNQ